MDGILIESEGYNYARYAAYVPEAMARRYSFLSKMNQELAVAVDFIIADVPARPQRATGFYPLMSWRKRLDYALDFCSNCIQDHTAESYQPKESRQTSLRRRTFICFTGTWRSNRPPLWSCLLAP